MNQYNKRGLLPLIIFLFFAGCSHQQSPEISTGIDGCALCNMTITQANQACGFYWAKQFVTFDSPGCLVQRYGSIKKEGGLVPSELYFADFNTSRLIPADSTFFLLTKHLPTVMNAGVLCFENQAAASALQEHSDEIITDWIGYWTLRGTPDRTIVLTASHTAFDPEVVILNKGELVQWRVDGEQLTSDLIFRVEGYNKIGEITVPASDEVHFRMYADRPGAGFPIINSANNQPLGMIKVEGAHTEDEEAM